MRSIPILMYHALEDELHPSGAKDPGEQRYVLQLSRFRDHMAYLKREGFVTVLLGELQPPAQWPDRAVVLTFDDGHRSNFTLALPVLQQFGFRAEFFITTGWMGQENFLNDEQIRGLHQAGMGVGSHGVSHAFLNELTADEMEKELRESLETLSPLAGGAVTAFSAPGGRINRTACSIAEQLGYRIICDSRSGPFHYGQSLLSVPRFSLRHDIDMAAFASLVRLDAASLRRDRYRNRLLSVAKTVLGNGLYEGVRRHLLGTVQK